MLIGSKDFEFTWQEWLETMPPKLILSNLMTYIAMPIDLSGQLEETQRLLAHFDPDLAPHDRFWKEVVKLVNQAFPGQELSQEGLLQRQIHQFRYLISSQQAEYVRRHYKQSGMTDRDALAVYLRWRPFTLFDGGRLHQKIAGRDGQVRFPDGHASVNLKILLYNRVEFILDSQGHFLNEIDGQIIREAGVVNGASFNYGNFKRHWQLDVEPIKPHDPDFRNQMTRGFRAPNKLKRRLGQPLPDGFEYSFYSAQGVYAQKGKSLASLVKMEAKAFHRLVWRSRIDKRLKS